MMKAILYILSLFLVGLYQKSEISSIHQSSTDLDNAVMQEIQNQENTLESLNIFPSLGFRNIKSDMVFLHFLQYFGDDKARDASNYNLSNQFFQSIIQNDPYYIDFYVFLTNSVSLKAAQPEQTALLLEKGLKAMEKNRLNDSFYVWRYKGIDELLFLNDAEAAENSFRMAANWAMESAHPDSELISHISQQTADFISRNPDSKEAQIGAWNSILSTAVDDDTRHRAIEGIRSLGGEVVISEDGHVTIKYLQAEPETER